MNFKKHLPLALLLTGLGTEVVAIYTAMKQGPYIFEQVEKFKESPNKDTGLSLVKTSALPVSMTAISMTSYICMYVLQRNNVANLTAALATSMGSYEIMRNAFKESHSENDILEAEIKEYDITDLKPKSEQKGFWFVNSPLYVEYDWDLSNAVFLDRNDRLSAMVEQRGWIKINDILEIFELEPTPEGKVLGFTERTWGNGLSIRRIAVKQRNDGELEYEAWISWPEVEMIV